MARPATSEHAAQDAVSALQQPAGSSSGAAAASSQPVLTLTPLASAVATPFASRYRYVFTSRPASRKMFPWLPHDGLGM